MFSFIGVVVVAIIVYLWLSGDDISIKITIDGEEKINYKKTSKSKDNKKEEDNENKK